jgi:hypothetical protein
VDDFAILKDIETLLESASVSSGNVSKAALLHLLKPELKYCLDRCDSSIQSMSELIEAFTFLEATIFHNRQMHASLHQKINIKSGKYEEFILYLTCLRDALATLIGDNVGTEKVTKNEMA